MNKIIITLIVAASAVVHAQVADLASQLQGYWQPDVVKNQAVAKATNRQINPLEQAMMGKIVYEFNPGKMIVHGPPGFTSDTPAMPYTVKPIAKTSNSLMMNVGGKEITVRIDKEQMAMNDPQAGWTVFKRMSKEDFAKRDGGGKASAAGKLEDISAQRIPNEPAAGKIQGKEFKVEKATFENGNLKLRQGSGFFADFEFAITLFNQKGGLDGKTITVKPNQSGTTAHIHISRMEKDLPATELIDGGYSMKLEFGTAKDGKFPGKIHLRVPDKAGSFVVGTFEAEIK